MRVVAIIPARLAATRFPGKPLAPILGLPMIEHIRRRAALATSIDRVVVATCDQEIVEVVRAAGGLLLPGGGDVQPSLYGASPHPTFDPAEAGRDEYEIELVRRALDHSAATMSTP